MQASAHRKRKKKKCLLGVTGSLLAQDIWNLTYCSQNLTGEILLPSFIDQATESRWLKNHSRYLNKPIFAPKRVLCIFLLVKANHQSFPHEETSNRVHTAMF